MIDLENHSSQELEGNIKLLPSHAGNNPAAQPVMNIGSSEIKLVEETKVPTTIDEPISETIMRDLKLIAYKLKYVLLPRMRKEKGKELRNWDLWGPLLLCLILALTLSISSTKDREVVFGTIFVIVWVGSIIVTLNAKLLKGKISFFQSVCVLGYCIFPLNISALAVGITKAFIPYIVKLAIVVGSFSWATISSVGFMATLVNEEKKVLAVYPVFLFYLFLSWFTLTC